MTPASALLLVLLGAIWGASFPFIRVAVPSFGPVPLMAARVMIAAFAFVLYFALTRRRLDLGREPWRYLVLGALNAAIPFALIAAAELRLNASLGAILNSTAPLFSVFVARIAFGASLRRAQVAGALIGIAGVGALVGVGDLTTDPEFVLAIAASLLAALSYAFGASYAARTFPGARPLDISAGQLIGATILLVPAAVFTLPPTAPPPEAIGAMLALALLSTVVAYLIYFRLIAEIGATRAIAVTLLVPVSGVLLGTIFLGEVANANLLLGLGLILIGVSLVTGVVVGSKPDAPSAGDARAA